MTNLTDKWKKGELPSGYYYVKNEFGNVFPSDYSEDYDYIGDTVIKDFFTEVSEIKEVIEPVPSYEQWKSSEKLILTLMDNIKDKSNLLQLAIEENAQLKEYERIVASYYMKPIDYETACATVNKLLDEKKGLRQENTKLKELLKGAREVLKMVDTYSGDYDSINGFLIVEKINQALGE